jgi:hypothetical protein
MHLYFLDCVQEHLLSLQLPAKTAILNRLILIYLLPENERL